MVGKERVDKQDINLYSGQIRSNVSFAAFMTAVVIFFVGVLLTKFQDYSLSVKVPVTFLIIGTFGFLYSALIYVNASDEIIKGRLSKFKRNMFTADVLSEYLGVYMLVLAIPLVINVITTDTFLRVIVGVISLLGFMFYQFSHFAISERHFPKTHRLITIGVIMLGVGLFFSQITDTYFEYFSVLLILFVSAMVFSALARKDID